MALAVPARCGEPLLRVRPREGEASREEEINRLKRKTGELRCRGTECV